MKDDSLWSIWIRLARFGDANPMVGEFEMRAGQIDLRHVARSAILRSDFTARRRASFAQLRWLRGARSGPRLVTGQAFRVVISFVMRRRLMRIVTRHAPDPGRQLLQM